MDTQPAQVELLGIRFAAFGQQALLDALRARIEQRTKTLVLSANVNSFNLAYEIPWLHRYFNQADILRVDGAGIRLAARLWGRSLPPRITWADFIWSLAAFAETPGYRLFFLGGRPAVAEAAAARLIARHPALQVVGSHHGYFNKEPGHPENKAVLQIIAERQPDILLVGMGTPVQERWLLDNWSRLGDMVVMTGGAVFDYASGRLRRAPPLLTRHGFEWLGRFLIEPKRLWRRYLIGNPLFFWRLLTSRFRRGQAGRARLPDSR